MGQGEGKPEESFVYVSSWVGFAALSETPDKVPLLWVTWKENQAFLPLFTCIESCVVEFNSRRHLLHFGYWLRCLIVSFRDLCSFDLTPSWIQATSNNSMEKPLAFWMIALFLITTPGFHMLRMLCITSAYLIAIAIRFRSSLERVPSFRSS